MGKFNFKQVGGVRSYRGWKNWEEGDNIVGKYVKAFEDKFGNPGYEIEVIECDFHDEKAIVEEGKVFAANSNGALNYKMEEVEIGSIIRIEYLGMETSQKGPFKGKEFHNVDLQVDDSTVVSRAVQAQKEVNEEKEVEAYDL